MNNDTLTRDPAIRNALANRATSYDLSLASLDDITMTATQRTRRSRLGSGIVFTLAALLFVGIGFSRSNVETSTFMFAGVQEADTAVNGPAAILVTDDGWIGATIVFTPTTLTPQSSTEEVRRANFGEVHIATSTDGERWELAEPTGLAASAPSFALDEHEGRYWLAFTGTDEVQLAFSDDLTEWTVVDLPPGASEFEREVSKGFEQVITPTSLVANQAGVMLKIDAREDPAFAQLIDVDVMCDLRWAVDVIEWRECGTSEFQETELDIEVPTYPTATSAPGGDSNLVFSADGETFKVFGAAEGDTRLPYSSGQRLYATESGFGLADYEVRESSDGETWTILDDTTLGRLSSPSFVAARDGERVASSSDPAATGLKHSIDGQNWTSHSVNELFDKAPETAGTADDEVTFNERGRFGPTYVVTELEGGAAGWAVSGWSRTGTAEYEDVLDRGETKPFTASVGDLTITGTMPGGPAELTAADGEIVRAWDRFEPMAPWHTGVDRDRTDLIFVDTAGNDLASIDLFEWNTQIENPRSPFIYAVLFSPDGMNWTKIHEGVEYVAGLSVGDDEVLVVTHAFGGLASERIAVDAAS